MVAVGHIKIDDTTPIIVYSVGATATAKFTVPFAFFEKKDLEVRVNGALKVLTADYTVTGAGSSAGGAITFKVAISSVTLEIKRWIPIERITDFADSGPLPIDGINTELDRQIAIDQQIYAGISVMDDRALKVPPGETVADVPAEVIRANKLLGFDNDADPIVTDSTLAEIDALPDLLHALEALIAGIQLGNPNIISVSSITTLRALTSATVTAGIAIVEAYVAGGEVGGGEFRLDLDDTTTADDNGLVIVDASGRRWKRMVESYATPEMFGWPFTGTVAEKEDQRSATVAACFARNQPMLITDEIWLLKLDLKALSTSPVVRGDIFRKACTWAQTCTVRGGGQAQIDAGEEAEEADGALIEVMVTSVGEVEISGIVHAAKYFSNGGHNTLTVSMPTAGLHLDIAQTGANSITFGARTGKVTLVEMPLAGAGTGYAASFPVTITQAGATAATGTGYAVGGVVMDVVMTPAGGGSGFIEPTTLTPAPITVDFSAGGGTGADFTTLPTAAGRVHINPKITLVTVRLDVWPTDLSPPEPAPVAGQPIGLYDINGPGSCAIINGAAVINSVNASAQTVSFYWSAIGDVPLVGGLPTAGKILLPHTWAAIVGGYDGTFNGSGGFLNTNNSGHLRLNHWFMRFKDAPGFSRKENAQGVHGHLWGRFNTVDHSIIVGFPERQVRMLGCDGFQRRLYCGGGLAGQYGYVTQNGGYSFLSEGAYGGVEWSSIQTGRGCYTVMSNSQIGSGNIGMDCSGGQTEISSATVAGCNSAINVSDLGVNHMQEGVAGPYFINNDTAIHLKSGGSNVSIPDDTHFIGNTTKVVSNILTNSAYAGGVYISDSATAVTYRGVGLTMDSDTDTAVAGAATSDTSIGFIITETLNIVPGGTYTVEVTCAAMLSPGAAVFLSRNGGGNTTGTPIWRVSLRAIGSFTIEIRNTHATDTATSTIQLAYQVVNVF